MPLLRVTVTPGPAAPRIRPTVTRPPSSAVPISKLSVILQPIASIPLAPASSATPLLNNGRGVRGAFQICLVFFVIFCESTGKHLFKIFNSFGSVSHSETPKYSRQLYCSMFRSFQSAKGCVHPALAGPRRRVPQQKRPGPSTHRLRSPR